jgi:DNA polymerase-3 subunit beta
MPDMKFSVSSSELLKQLQIAGGAIGSNPVLPILEDFLFSISNNKLTITASDLETSILTEMEVASDTDGKVAVPGKILLETLKALPHQPVTFAVNTENHGIEITSAYGKYRLAGENGEDFPQMPEEDGVDNVSLPAAGLLDGISKTIFATSNDELRPAMTGVLFSGGFQQTHHVWPPMRTNWSNSAFTAVGRRSFYHVLHRSQKSPQPAENCFAVARINVTLSFNKANAFFALGNTRLVCRLIDARYPDYNAVIPVDNPNNSMTVIAAATSKTRSSGSPSTPTKPPIRWCWTCNEKSLTMSAQDLDFSNEATEQMTCNFDGTPLTHRLQCQVFGEMLGVLDSRRSAKWNSLRPSRAGILTPVEENQHTTGTRY